ncbi:MAG: fused signal recognition particle receptor [Candidatus Woesearchaeota archaeon]|nr:fused signal recognition particle receptor [Candidatus Woesearchaeota archaeon]
MFELFKKGFRKALKNATKNLEEDEISESLDEEIKDERKSEEIKTEESRDEIRESHEIKKTKAKSIEEIEESEETIEEELEETIEESERENEEKNEEELQLEKTEKTEKQVKKEKPKESEKSDKTDKESRGFFRRVFSGKVLITEEKFESIFWEIELMLLENNVAYEVIEEIKKELAEKIVGKEFPRGKIQDVLSSSIKEIIENILLEPFDLIDIIKQKRSEIKNETNVDASKRPYVILFLGVNGSGKTTTLAKIAYLLKKNGLSCVLAASDTFRAAAIQQLEKHAEALGVRLIKHDYGADSAAVAYDSIEYAKAKGIDVVLIDSAGRLHSNRNLMDELAKLVRVSKPDLKLFVGEMLTGNDCIEQAKEFDKAVGIDAVILTKSDVDEKGGTAISIGYVLKKPILFLGIGQNYSNLEKFDKKKILDKLF